MPTTIFKPGFDYTPPEIEAVGVKDFLARPRLVATFATSGPYLSLNLLDTWRTLPAVQAYIKGWRHMNGDMEVTISFTGSSAAMGMARFSFTPANPGFIFNGITPALPIAMSNMITNSSNQPHLDFDFTQTSNQKIVLPFNSPYVFVNTAPGAESFATWNLEFSLINAIRDVMGGTPEHLYFQVFVALKNVRLDVIIEQSGEVPQRAWSNALEYASIISSKLPFAFATPLSLSLKAGSSVAKFLGWSRPLVVAQDLVVATNLSSLAYGSGQPNLTQSMAIDPSAVRNVAFGSIPMETPGETTFMGIASRYSQVRAGWLPGETVPVAPMRNTHNLLDPLVMQMTHMDFATSMFSYWSGSIEFCIQVIGSPLVRWKIGVVILPPNAVVPLTFPTEGEFLTTIIDIAGSTCTEIMVPYLHRPPMNFVTFATEAVSVGDTSIVYYSLTPPTGPSPTNVYPHVNVWVRAGPDYSCAVPSLTSLNNYFIYQSGEVGPTREPARIGGVGNISMAITGEVIDDLLMLTRRSCLTYSMTGAATGFLAFPVDTIAPTSATFIGTTMTANQWSFASWLASAFLGHTGGVTHAISGPVTADLAITSGYVAPGSTAPVLSPKVLDSLDSTGTVLNSSDSTLTQFVVPDRTPLRFKTPSKTSGDNVPARTCVVVRNRWSPTAVITIEDYVAGADDFKVGGYLCPPLLRYRA